MTERLAPTAASMTPASAGITPFSAGPDSPREGGHFLTAVLDPAGTVLAIDSAGADAPQWVATVGRPLWDAPCWGTGDELIHRLREATRAAAAGAATSLELEVPPHTGCDARILSLSLRPGRDSAGKVTALIASARDLSAWKEVEQELAQRNGELQALYENIRELDALKMQFFANVSHELRTPLALILGSSERLITDVDLASETRHNAEVVARNARLLLRHVNDLLDIAKLEARKMRVQYEVVDLARLVRHTAEHFDALASERRMTYVVETPETLVAEIDAEKVERVLLNLLSNAFKFTPPGGSILVRTGVTPNSAATGTDVAPGTTALVAVLDSGPGVAPDQREAIFERFAQGPVSATRRFGGTGLGLAIAKDFIELHCGTISVGDAPGGGAAFEILLPLVAARPALERVSTPAEPGIAIDMAQQTLDELRTAVADPPPPLRRNLRGSGVSANPTR